MGIASAGRAVSAGSLATRRLLAACLGAAGLVLTPAIAPTGEAAAAECRARGPTHADCGVHNMMVVGEQAIFLSHLPMFNSEHRFQAIFEAALDRGGANLDALYADDRRRHPAVKMYTLNPSEPFVLARLFGGEPEAPMRSFPGTLFRGHLERGGEPLQELAEVQVTVRRVVYAQEIGPPAGPARSDTLDYLLFGRGSELFLAHRIAQPPDFDQLLGVDVSGHSFSEEELARGVSVTVLDRPNSPSSRLRAGERVPAQGHVTGADLLLPLEVEVAAEYYFEEGELRADPDPGFDPFEPTALETEAGF